MMGHPPWSFTCVLFLILYPVAFSQDSKPESPSSRLLRHHRHHHHGESHKRAAAEAAKHPGSDVDRGEDDAAEHSREASAERGEGENEMMGEDHASNEDLQGSWSATTAAFPPQTEENSSPAYQRSVDDQPLEHEPSLNPSKSNHQQSDGSKMLVSHTHNSNLSKHHSDQNQDPSIQGQDSDFQPQIQPLSSWKERDGFHKADPKVTKPNGVLFRAFGSLKSFFSEFHQTLTGGNSSKRPKKERRQSKQISNRKQVNRPRWYFRHDKPNDAEDGKKDEEEEEKKEKSRWSKESPSKPVWNKASDKAGGKKQLDVMDYLDPQPAVVSDVGNNYYQKMDRKGRHTEVKAVHTRQQDGEEEGKKRDSGKRGMSREPGSGKEKSGPLVKECVGCTEAKAKIAEARELHKQVLRAQLLDKLRLSPSLTQRPLPPKLPEQVFPDIPQHDHPGYSPSDDHYYATPTRLLVFGRDLGKQRLRKPGTGSYTFQIRGKVKGEVTQADLWVYKMHDARDSHGQTLVVTQLHHRHGRHLRERSLVARLDTHVQEGWVRFDVTDHVQRWLSESEMPSQSQMLAIRCKTCHRTSYRAIFGVKSNFRPVLVIKERRLPHQDSLPRDKRSRSQCDPNNRCCKFDLVVRFHDLGIHEIFYPKTIQTGYCYGTCERPDLHYHNHTAIIQRLRYGSHRPVDSGLRERLRPCCVPVVLREVSVMHYVNQGLDTQVSIIPNMLVDRCGCA